MPKIRLTPIVYMSLIVRYIHINFFCFYFSNLENQALTRGNIMIYFVARHIFQACRVWIYSTLRVTSHSSILRPIYTIRLVVYDCHSDEWKRVLMPLFCSFANGEISNVTFVHVFIRSHTPEYKSYTTNRTV
jgi:hypothetical protein